MRTINRKVMAVGALSFTAALVFIGLVVVEINVKKGIVAQTYQYQKLGAKIKISKLSGAEYLVPGEVGEWRYAFVSANKQGVMTVHLRVDEEANSEKLSILSEARQFTFDLAKQQAVVDLSLVADHVGTAYLQFFIEYNGRTRALTRHVHVGTEEQRFAVRGIKPLQAKAIIKNEYEVLPVLETKSAH